MNRFVGTVVDLVRDAELAFLTVSWLDGIFQVMCPAVRPDGGLWEAGDEVELSVSPIHVGLSVLLRGRLSLRNRVPAIITQIEKGRIQSLVRCATDHCLMESLITTAALEELGLEAGEKVELLIKSSDISVCRVNTGRGSCLCGIHASHGLSYVT